DEQMMEYFYLIRLLNEGGIIAINTRAPARQELVDYIRKNRHDYAVRVVDDHITLVQIPKYRRWQCSNLNFVTKYLL
ncbi:hypothetical protein, partial [Pseudomonas viridiflava]|uniref:hypothetical protein n=1 Tax=Pseudomonas viridiflava TaxID=33069 RepID=UPI00197E15B3